MSVAHVPAPKSPPWVRLAEQRATADTLLRVYEVEYPPVDVEMLARRMHIELLPESTGSEISGRIEVDAAAARAVIRVRRDHAPWRQRFTIAHEIGHLMRGHAESSTTCLRWLGGTPEESEANRYAADLLMPMWMLEPLMLQYGADWSRLARLFQVSEDAMKIRLSVLTGVRSG